MVGDYCQNYQWYTVCHEVVVLCHEVVLLLFKGFKDALNICFILVNPYLFRELNCVQDIIEIIKKDNCIFLSDDCDSYDEDSILDINIRHDFLMKDAIREGGFLQVGL